MEPAMALALLEHVAPVGMVIGADGRRSIVRESAGIAMRGGLTGQTAIVTRFAHTRPVRAYPPVTRRLLRP